MHGLRVALGCSKWAAWRKLSDSDRTVLEVAALLHDVGKIGVPDRVLQKPTHLNGQEQLMMEMQSQTAIEILRGAGANQELLDIVRHARRVSLPLASVKQHRPKCWPLLMPSIR
ncbi:MAG: HD domain-containing protein [Pirellulaceae bacterium]